MFTFTQKRSSGEGRAIYATYYRSRVVAKAATLTAENELTYASFPIEKVEQDENGDVLVWGKATDGSIDSDQQIVDPDFAAKAIDEFFVSGPNIRVQHQAQRDPAGVGISYEKDDDAHWVKSKIIEPVAKRLVLGGALRAYSVGIARPTIQRDAVARGGRITDGQIVEISLVDRPANKNCQFQLVKAAKDGTMEWVGKMVGSGDVTVKMNGQRFEGDDVTITLPPDVHIGFSPADMARILKRKAASAMDGEHPDDCKCMTCKGSDTDSVEKRKLTTSARNALPDSAFVFPADRRYPIHDESHARNALSRVAQHGTPEEKAKVRAAVARRYPNIGKKGKKKAAKAAAQVAQSALPDVTKPVEKKDKAACMKCGAMQNDKHMFCSECGSSMSGAMPVEKNHDFMCLGCGREMDKGEKFCPGCGRPNPGHNPMADMKIPANKAMITKTTGSCVAKAKKKGKGKGGKPFGGNQAPPFGKDKEDGDEKGMDAPVAEKDAVRYDGGVPAGSAKAAKAKKKKGGGFGHTATPAGGVTGMHAESVPEHREPDGLDVAAFEHSAGLPTDSQGDRQTIPAVKGGKLGGKTSDAIPMETGMPSNGKGKRKKAKQPSMSATPDHGVPNHDAHPIPGSGMGPANEEFDRNAGKSADPEIGRVMRLKSLGVPEDLGYAHDLVCPAYGWDDLVKCYPSGLENFSAYEWQQKALSAAASAPLAEAQAASQLGQHAFTIKSADLADLIDVKGDLNKAFRDANPGPGSFPTPGEIHASQFQRPKITSGLAAYSHQYGSPNGGPVPAGSIHAGAFGRGFIQSGRAEDSPANKSGAPYPPETGKPVNLDYSSIHKSNVAQAFMAMHDHFDRVFPGVCPMNAAASGPGKPVHAPATKSGEPDVVKKVSADGMSKKQRARRDKKLVRRVMKGKMPLDEARIKMGKKPKKSPDPLAPQKAAGKGIMAKMGAAHDAGATTLLLSQEDVTKAVAAALQKAKKRSDKQIATLTKVVTALADQPDPRTQPFKGLARNPIQKSAGPAGVQTIAESAERAQLMVVRELENTARNSPDPTTREAAWHQFLKLKGLVT